MTRSRKVAKPRDEEQHRSKTRTDHRAGESQRTRPPRRGAVGHPQPTRMAAESALAGNDRLSDVAAVAFFVLNFVFLVVFFAGPLLFGF